jgi:predicted dehydrogenase
MKRIGMIGAGNIAQVHLEGWRRLPVEIAAHYDVRPEAAQQAAAKFGGKACASIKELFDRVDLVDICTPGNAHKENVLAAADAGKPMVCEKPLARHLADCEAIVAACERTQTPLFVAQVVRFFPEFAKAKEILDSGAIGKPAVIRTIRAGSYIRWSPYFSSFALSGGVVLDVGVHDIDFQRWCCGDVERVFARGLTFANSGERDHALITLRFTSGAVGHIEAGWANPTGQWRTRIEICGDGGMLEWDREQDGPVTQIMVNQSGDGPIRTRHSPLSPDDNPYYAELAHFLACLENGQPFRVSPRDGLEAVKVALAAIESIRTGRVVELANFRET